jgi:hypothetical protein
LVLRNFDKIDEAVARLIDPPALARYRANAAALHNRAVFEIPDILEQIFERSRGVTPSSGAPVLAAKLA